MSYGVVAPDWKGEAMTSATSGETDTPTAVWETAAREFIAWRSGDPHGLERLVRAVTPTLWHIARAHHLDRQTAEDVVQTTWLALARNADQVRDPQAVLRWTVTTVRREAWRQSRLRRTEEPADEAQLDRAMPSTPGPEDTVVANADAQALWARVSMLSQRCQQLLRILAFDLRPDYANLSGQLGMAVGSIGPTRGRCLDRLRRLLANGPDRVTR
jgi:RNA polymerase sigma factor (sigma-70 family)